MGTSEVNNLAERFGVLDTRQYIDKNVFQTEEKIKEIFKHWFTYKKNFHFSVRRTFDTLLCTISFEAENCLQIHNDNKPIRLEMNRHIPESLIYDFSEDRFLKWLRQLIIDVEMHEVDEWIKFKGVRTFNPHTEKIA